VEGVVRFGARRRVPDLWAAKEQWDEPVGDCRRELVLIAQEIGLALWAVSG
jgi:hypothetical protein